MKNHFEITYFLVSLLVGLAALGTFAEEPYVPTWSVQFGTDADDQAWSTAVDGSGNLFVSGNTYGSLAGANYGESDAFLSKYDAEGNLLWVKQLGSMKVDVSYSVAVDGTGNAFISGVTEQTDEGQHNAFLAKYDPMGNLLWNEQLSLRDVTHSGSVKTDSQGNAYIGGYMLNHPTINDPYDDYAFLSKYDPDGALLWTHQLDTNQNGLTLAVEVDAMDYAYLSGWENGYLGEPSDAYVAKFTPSGNILWKKTILDVNDEIPVSMAIDNSGNIVLCGNVFLSVHGTFLENEDIYLAKLDSGGDLLWSQRIHSSQGNETAWSIAVDSHNDIFISGYSDGDLGQPNAGGQDIYVAKYDSQGNELWSELIGTEGNDLARSVMVESSGDILISGRTEGDLFGSNAGGYDGYVVRLSVPEPSCLILAGIGILAIQNRRG